MTKLVIKYLKKCLLAPPFPFVFVLVLLVFAAISATISSLFRLTVTSRSSSSNSSISISIIYFTWWRGERKGRRCNGYSYGHCRG